MYVQILNSFDYRSMASKYVDYKLSELGDLKITCFENIGRELGENNIIPTYKTHLEKVNTCIKMLDDLENNRFLNRFTDWVHGERSKINVPRLRMHLNKLRTELEIGIKYYERLLKMYKKMLKYERLLTFSRYKLSDKSTKVPEISLMNHVGRGAGCAGIGAVAGGIAGASIGATLAYTGMLNVSASSLAIVGASTGVGILAVGAAGGAMYLIYAVANSYGRKRGVKYHEIRSLYETLDTNYLGSIKTDHEDLQTIYDFMDERMKKVEATLDLAKTKYLEEKQKSFQALKEEGESVKMCELMSKRDAKKECIYFLIHKLDCLREEAEEYVKEILKCL